MSKRPAFQESGVLFSPLMPGVMPQIIDYVLYIYKDGIFVYRLKINHA
jgi:hypothetical protein